jgi:hypothetical protein
MQIIGNCRLARAEAAATVPRILIKGNLARMSAHVREVPPTFRADGPARYLLHCSILVPRAGPSRSTMLALSRPSGLT